MDLGPKSVPFILTLVLMVGLSPILAQDCPPDEVLAPCFWYAECDAMICLGYHDFDLKKLFSRMSQYVDDDVVFSSLQIVNTNITEIEDGTMESLKFEYIYIYDNDNLRRIAPQAFNATRNVTKFLQLGIAIGDDPTHKDDLFGLIKNFQKLIHLGIQADNLTSIPDKAFQSLCSLEQLSLYGSNISSIGSLSFNTGTDDLKFLELSHNAIPSEGLLEDAFEGISRQAEVDLSCNRMEFMEMRSFQTLLERAAIVRVGGSRCSGAGDPPQRFYCDERADWICDNEGRYRPKLEGFLCKEDSGFDDIWEYCADRRRRIQ